MGDILWQAIDSIDLIPKSDWNRLVSCQYPFIQYDYLLALEQSGSVGQGTGWRPCHLIAVQAGKLLAAIPTYQKLHSYGEYVFDFEWANAYYQVGLNYYPKVTSAIPFTPSQGPRLLVAANIDKLALVKSLSCFLNSYLRDSQLSSWHLLFPDHELKALMEQIALITRSGLQYHWFNRGYQSFENFLSACRAKPRKNIRRERKCLSKNGLTIHRFKKQSIDRALWLKFYRLYQHTYMKRSGHSGYLTPEFFEQLVSAENINPLLIAAFDQQDMIACALFFYDDKRLYGRYWGALREIEFLHFELCYYQGIEFAIANKLAVFDAGAQGEHKIARGFEPIETFSNHLIIDDRFHQAITQVVEQERHSLLSLAQVLKSRLPYNNGST